MGQRKCEGVMLVVTSWKFECQARLQNKPLRHDTTKILTYIVGSWKTSVRWQPRYHSSTSWRDIFISTTATRTLLVG